MNLRFAHAVADEAERCTGRAMAWIQDYHFALAAEFLRAMRPSLFIHQFWHIPFPPPDILRLLPTGTHEAVLRGMLGNDLIEFQIDRYAANFLDCVEKFVPEARVDHANQTIAFRDRVVQRRRVPDQHRRRAVREDGVVADSAARVDDAARAVCQGRRASSASASTASTTRREFPSAFARSKRCGTESPELRERFTFIFVCTPSRTDLPAYNALERDVIQSVIAINAEFGNARLDADRLDQRERRLGSARRRLSRRPTCASCRRCRTE